MLFIFVSTEVEFVMRLTKAIFLVPILFFFVFNLTPTNASQFKLKNVTDKAAVCNSGEVANFWLSEQGTNKWLIQLPGGGAAWSAKVYAKRGQNKKKPAKGQTQPLSNSAIAKQFHGFGYNVLKLHYCSSDLYAGNHSNNIDGKSVPFKGRKIVESIISEYEEKFRAADDIVIAGTSAGVYGAVLNIDLWSKFDNSRFILDSIWRDDFQKTLKTPDNKWTKFPLGKMPSHCKGDFLKNCSITRSTLEAHGMKEAFLIFNFGDPYNWSKKDNQKTKFTNSFKKDAMLFGGGFSVDAKKYKLAGAEKWGHGLLTQSKYYDKKIGGKSLSQTIEQWVKTGKSIHIHY
tara:strand:+ start:606 stop:1637 length:1032 start_codon:yes stop_codon:yes gene_type:complete